MVLALSGPAEALLWLLSQFLRYFFLWNLWKWIGRIGPSNWRKEITFSSLANPPPPLLLYWCGNGSPLLLLSGVYTGTCKMNASPSSTSLGNIPGKLFCYTLGSIREKGKSNKGLGGMELNPFEMLSDLCLVHLHPGSAVEPGGASKTHASVRDRLSLIREGKLQWKVCLHAHLEQRGMPPVERSHSCGCHFFSLTDGN